MRTKLGVLVSVALLGAMLSAGVPVRADDADTSTTVAPVEAAEDVATSDEPTTTTTTTTTTTVPAFDPALLVDAASVEAAAGVPTRVDAPGDATAPAWRAPAQVQLREPPSPPPTAPPGWVLPENSGAGRRVVYSKTNQWVWIVEADGTVVKDHQVSGNRATNLPRAGTYSVSSRSMHTCALAKPSLCWRYMVRFARGPNAGGRDNIGFHEIPTNTRTGQLVQGTWQLGQPLSGGCVRQTTPDAQFMWDWAGIGTTVVVLP